MPKGAALQGLLAMPAPRFRKGSYPLLTEVVDTQDSGSAQRGL